MPPKEYLDLIKNDIILSNQGIDIEENKEKLNRLAKYFFKVSEGIKNNELELTLDQFYGSFEEL
ncbi:MAG: hypothetical protein VKK42_09280 [Lyngbya sp.]|nr:hypothetical protein [Lyngbya sp.]